MKKILALLLAIAMAATIAACTGGGGTTTTAPTTTTTTTTAEAVTEPPTETTTTTTEEAAAASSTIKADIFWYTFGDTYLTSVRNAMEGILGGIANVNYTMFDCEEDQAKQTQMVETALTQGTDLLIVNIVTTGSEEAAQNICDLAKAAGVPIIFFNREVSDSVVNSYDKCCFVGTDADEAGVMQGQAAAQYLLAGDTLAQCDLDGDKEIKYIMFRGEHGNAEAFGRTLYSVQEANNLIASAGYKLVPSAANETSTLYDDDGISNYFLYGNWSAANAAELMRTALSQYRLNDGSIELIFANNDDQAIGAIEAMNEAGYNTGAADAGYIPVFGVDATDIAQDAINNGRMTGTVLQDAQGMAACIALLATNVANGMDPMSSTGQFTNIDAGVDKIRIPYAIVSSSAPTAPTAVGGGGPIKVDIFWYTFADTYLASVRNAMEGFLAGADNINYTMIDSENDQAKQTQMIETALTQGTDLLIVNIVTTGSEEAAQNVADLAKAAGVPLIFFNREVGDSVVNSYDLCSFVGTDADEAGYMEGQAIAEFLQSADNLTKYDIDGDNEIKYIMFRGEHGNAEAFGRTKYSVQEANRLLEASGYKLVPSAANETSNLYDDDGISNFFLYGNWSAAEAANLMRTALSQYSLADGTIELIIANNDDQAIGAIEAMNEIGFNTGAADAGYIPVFGVDATDIAQDAISNGRMTGTVLQDASGMAECIAMMAGNVAGGQAPMSNTGKFTNIDQGVDKIRIPYAIVK